jgi:hypothetical protein
MTRLFAGGNVAVFVLFFGVAFLQALQTSRWLMAAVFAGLGLLALWADRRERARHRQRTR